MSPRSLLRPVAVLAAVAVAVGLTVGLAPARRAAALPLPLPGLTGLEQLVGALGPTVLAQLPADPRLFASYSTRPTPAPCRDGAPTCIDTTIAGMTARFDGLVPSCDHDAAFSLLYLRVTERYKQVAETPGYFGDVAAVNQENAVFSDLYAGAFVDWHARRPGQVPPIWRLAFAAADARQETGLGDLLLGMSAHILRDLPFAIERVGVIGHDDHIRINAMLRSVYSSVVGEAARRLDPTISLADTVPGSDVLVVDVIAQWREQGWRNAQALLAAPDAPARQAVADRIEREAWATGLALYLGERYPVQALTVTRDSYCASRWNT